MMRSQLVLRLIQLTGALLFGFSASLTAGNMDPLDADEASLAAAISQPVRIETRRGLKADTDTTNTASRETLLIERRQSAKNITARLADVYVYDYSTDELEQSVVDLDTQMVISKTRSQGVQLPLTAAEIKRARDIIRQDDEEYALISTEYQRVMGIELGGIEQLNIKAFTFHAASLPQKTSPASRQCGIHRCAQVLLFTHDNVIFEISPIVDLSANVVTQNIGF